MKRKTLVKFYMEVGGVFAVFPQTKADFNGYRKDNITCYSHIGQHSACNPDYLKGKPLAKFNQYQDLLRELIGQGYTDLQVANLWFQETECHRPPTKGEINFGEGATHYRTFRLSDIGLNKKGDLKKWFISPDDHLRYNRY